MRCRGAAEEGIDPEEGRRAEDRAHVVRISHAVERDGRSGISKEQVGEVMRRQPRSRMGHDAETLVVVRSHEAIELGGRHLAARNVVIPRPADEFLNFGANDRRVRDPHDIVWASSKDCQSGAKPIDALRFRLRSLAFGRRPRARSRSGIAVRS
jgi:hypothetical protein